MCNPSQDVRHERANRSGTSGTTKPNCRKTVAGRFAPLAAWTRNIPSHVHMGGSRRNRDPKGGGLAPLLGDTPPAASRSFTTAVLRGPRASAAQDSETNFPRAAGRKHSAQVYPCLVEYPPSPPPARPMCMSSACWVPAAKATFRAKQPPTARRSPRRSPHENTAEAKVQRGPPRAKGERDRGTRRPLSLQPI